MSQIKFSFIYILSHLLINLSICLSENL
jgi:hypothetical protein